MNSGQNSFSKRAVHKDNNNQAFISLHDNNIWWHFCASGRFHNENCMSKNIYHTKNYIHHWFYDTLQKLSFVVLI